MSKLKQTKHVAHKFTGFDKVSLVGLLIQVPRKEDVWSPIL